MSSVCLFSRGCSHLGHGPFLPPASLTMLPFPPPSHPSLPSSALPFFPLPVLPVSPPSYFSSSVRSPAPPPISPSVSMETCPFSPACLPLPTHLSLLLSLLAPPPSSLPDQSLAISPPPLNLLAAPSTCLQGRRASYPARLGGVSVGPCPWGNSLGAVLAALAAQEGREQGPGEGRGRRERAPGPASDRGKEWLAEHPGIRRGQGERREEQSLES